MTSGGQERSDRGQSLDQRLAAVLDDILPVQQEDDGALTVRHEETIASLRVVTISEGLDMVSLTQILAWDLPVDSKIRNQVARHARNTLLGTVSLVEKSAAAKRNSKKAGDVLLRYNFPGAGLTDDALRTLILLVLGTGADIRRDLVG
jgi:hypothetical protein